MSSLKVQLGARVSRSTRDRAKKAAEAAGLSLNQFTEDALVAALGPHTREASGEPLPATQPTEGVAPPVPAPPPMRLPLPGIRNG